MLVRFYAVAREIAGCDETTLGVDSLRALASALSQQFGPRMEQLVAASTLLHNGNRHRSTDAVALRTDDTVDLLPPFAGG